MADEDMFLFLALACESDSPPPKRRIWVRESLNYRGTRGEYATLLREARNNPEDFYRSYRMTPERFDELLDYVAPRLKKEDTNYRAAIPEAERLAMTIKENQYMRKICLEAKAFGDMPLPAAALPRHVTVILNPTAGDGKCRAQFDKYCAPLLHLAGLKVGIVKTEKEGQAKDLMEIMDNTDAVLVAGGDGTVAEVVTGLMRRSDRAQAVRRFPLALVPLGKTNSVAAALLGESEAETAARIARTTMALVREVVRPLDVMEVQALETEAEVPGRPVYLLSEISWGAFRDVQAKVSKYWYWGALKERMAYVFNAFKELTWRCDAEMEYMTYCAGCSRCQQQRREAEQQQQQQQQQQRAGSGRWWARLIPPPKPVQTQTAPEVDYSAVDNPSCGVWVERPVSTVDWSLHTSHMRPDAAPGLHLRLGSGSMTSSEFIREGWRRLSGAEPTAAEQLTVQQVRLVPAEENRSVASGGDETPNSRWFSFDHEDFEVRPILIKLLPKEVRVFSESAPQAQVAG